MKVKNKIVEQDEVNSGAKHDFIFQFVDAENGNRSEPFLSSWTQLIEVLQLRTEEQAKPTDEDFILLVAVMDGKQTHIPSAPLIKVGNFLTTMNTELHSTGA